MSGCGVRWVWRPAPGVMAWRWPAALTITQGAHMARDVADPLWPSTLRQWRARRGLSLRQLADRAHLGKSQLARLETGQRAPDRTLAARLDEILEAGGALAGLVTAAGEADERLAHALSSAGRVDAGTVEVLTGRLAGYRTLEDDVGAAAMLPTATAHVAAVDGLLRRAYGPHRAGLVCAAAQWAQWTGWLHLAQDQIGAGVAVLGRALEWATEAGDGDLAATALSFRGYAAEQRDEPGTMIGLAEAILRDGRVYVGQRAYDQHMAARGYAMVGESGLAREALACAVDLAAESTEDGGQRPPWHYYRTPPYWEMETGLVWALLGDRGRAAERLTAGLAGLPADQRRAEWTGQYRRALAEVSPDAVGTPTP